MTMVISGCNSGQWFLLGDLLISGDERPGASPTFPNMLSGIEHVFPSGSGFVPLKLRRKIYVLRDDIAIGFAGREVDLAVFLRDMRNACQQLDMTSGQLIDFFKAYDADPENVSSILLAVDGGIVKQILKGAVDAFPDYSPFSNLAAAGSGVNDFVRRLRESRFAVLGIADAIAQNLAFPMVIATQVLARELLGGDNLLLYYGGGFEFIVFDGKRFRNLSDFSHVACNIERTADGWGTLLPVHMTTQSTDGEMTKIFSSNWHQMAGFGAIPLDSRPADFSRTMTEPPTFHKNYVFVSVLGKRDSGAVFMVVVLPSPVDQILFNWKDRSLAVWIAEPFSKQIGDQLDALPDNVFADKPARQGIDKPV